MPSPFDEIDAAAQAAIDETFGEGIRVRPMRGGNYAKAGDPDRPARDLRATVSRAPAVSAANYPSTNRKAAGVAASPTEIWIDRAAYASLGYELRRGDVIVLADDEGAPEFIATAVHPADNGDVQIPLVAAGTGAE